MSRENSPIDSTLIFPSKGATDLKNQNLDNSIASIFSENKIDEKNNKINDSQGLNINTNINNTDNNINTNMNKANVVLPNISMLSDLPRTPTYTNAELSTIPQSNVDFDTAAFMLMSNVDNENFNDISNSPKVQLPHISSLTPIQNSPNYFKQQSSSLANNYNNFNFDSIGNILLSPKTTSLLNSNFSDYYNSQINPPLPSNLNVINSIYTSNLEKSPKLTLPTLKAFSTTANNHSSNTNNPDLIDNISLPKTPNSGMNTGLNNFMNFNFTNQSPNLISNNIPSPLIPNHYSSAKSPSMINMNDNKFSNAVGGADTLGLGLFPHNELLTNTETMALESFLDSIANEPLKHHNVNENDDINFTKKRAQSEINIELRSKFNEGSIETNRPTKKRKKSSSGSILTDSAMKKMSREERKLYHNITEQKRRDSIKEAFNKLQNMIIDSKYDLEEKEFSDEGDDTHDNVFDGNENNENNEKIQKKKSKRKKKNKPKKNNRKNLKKYEVLNRAIKEIQILQKLNEELKEKKKLETRE